MLHIGITPQYILVTRSYHLPKESTCCPAKEILPNASESVQLHYIPHTFNSYIYPLTSTMTSNNTPQWEAPKIFIYCPESGRRMETFLHEGSQLPQSIECRSQKRRPVKEGKETDKDDVQGRRLPSLTDPGGQQHNHCRRAVYPHAGPEYHTYHNQRRQTLLPLL